MYENAFTNIEKALRAEAGIANELDYVEQISWVLFLKYLHDLEAERRDIAELRGKAYNPILPDALSWDSWAYPEVGSELAKNALIGDDLIAFLDKTLFPELAKLNGDGTDPATRERFLVQLDERGYGTDKLEQVQELVDAVNSDLFDVLAYILFGLPAKTRDQRASKVDVSKLADGDEEVSKFLQSILKSYVDEGESQLSSAKLEDHMKARYHSVGEGKEVLGGVTRTRRTYRGFQQELYQG